MEVAATYILSFVRNRPLLLIAALFILPLCGHAQNNPKYYIDKGKEVIKISIKISDSSLDNFIHKHNMADLDLTDLIRKNISDSLRKKGWKVFREHSELVITKSINDLKSPIKERPERPEQPEHPEQHERNSLMQMMINFSNMLSTPEKTNNIFSQSGANTFRNKWPFKVDSVVTFYLRGHLNVHEAFLAGNFTNWQNGKLAMRRTDSGWIARVKLAPGKYYYKFILDGNWTTDIDNELVENDGNGNDNSVYYKTNKTFTLAGHPSAKKVFLAGSFNNWNAANIAMEHTGSGWQAKLFLAPGTYTYRFVVDGKWMADPANNLKVPNEFNDFNSVIAIGNAHVFTLKGHLDAKKVLVAGNFNGWSPNQLYMTKTAGGWTLSYVLGPGNYEYKFIVDGKWMTDPANPLTVTGNNEQNSYLILSPNHTFTLKGHTEAKAIYLAGDFDEWSANTLLMRRDGDVWRYSIYLSPGKHLYKFVIDGRWIKDPANPLWEDNDNSIIWKDR